MIQMVKIIKKWKSRCIEVLYCGWVSLSATQPTNESHVATPLLSFLEFLRLKSMHVLTEIVESSAKSLAKELQACCPLAVAQKKAVARLPQW